MKEELKNWAKNDKKRLIKNFKGNNGFSPPDNYFPHDRIFTNIPNEKFENPILLLEWVILDIAEEEDLWDDEDLRKAYSSIILKIADLQNRST